jgi:N-acetylmuramoyl-L-alanine amidase
LVSPLRQGGAAGNSGTMFKGWDRRKQAGLAMLAVLVVAIVVLIALSAPRADRGGDDGALFGEARTGGLTVALQGPVDDVVVTEARAPGRPIVLLDPGHGGPDGGAPGVSGQVKEKDLTLIFSRELRDLLAERGRVRVAMTRNEDRSLSLEQRAAIARKLGAGLLVSIHMDLFPVRRRLGR